MSKVNLRSGAAEQTGKAGADAAPAEQAPDRSGPPRSAYPAVSVVMAVRNEAAHLDAALDAVFAQDYPGPLEVVVADGGSTDRTPAILRKRRAAEPRLRVVDNPDREAAPGLNRAVEASRGEVVVRCDGHSEPAPGYVRTAVNILRETGAANVGGRQRAEGAAPVQRAAAAAMNSPFGMGNSRFRTSSTAGPADTVYLGVFTREALEEAGGFDPSLRRNQDYELNYRLRKAGKLVWYDPRLEVVYRPRPSLRLLWRQFFDYGRWKRYMLARSPRALAWRQTAPPLLVLGLAFSAAAAAARLPLWWVIPLCYLAFLAAGAAVELARGRGRAAWLLPPVLAVMHLAWGAGFLLGPVRGR